MARSTLTGKAHDQSFGPYLAAPRLVAVVESALGSHARISFTSAIINQPGKARQQWHADWLFNQCSAARVPAPYPDVCMHLTTLWMLSPFTQENGGTLIVPASHRTNNNPTGGNGVDPEHPYPTELLVCGPASSVLVFDSRM